MELESAIGIILQWNSTTVRKDYVFDGYRQEIDQYLQAIDRVQASINNSDQTQNAQNAIKIAMDRLREEFRNILILNAMKPSSFIDPGSNTWSNSVTDSTSFNLPVEEDDYLKSKAIGPEVIDDLRGVAERMKSASYLQDCAKVYISVRKPNLNDSFEKLKVPRVSSGGVRKLEGEELENIIKEWIRAATICVKILFAYERRLCWEIFHDIGESYIDSCFLEIVKEPITQLLNFAEVVSSVSPSHGKLFRILDLYKVWLELSPKFDDLFKSEACKMIRIQATQVLVKLSEAVRVIMVEFEKAVSQDQSRVFGVELINYLLPYVNKVMNYERLLCNYEQTFNREMAVFKQLPGNASDSTTSGGFEEQAQPLSSHLISIIDNLVLNLEGKSKHYKDASDAYLFTRNNIHFIVRQIESNQRLREIIGQPYLSKLNEKLLQTEQDHLKLISERMLFCLRYEGLEVNWICCYTVSKTELRKRIESFNAMFEEAGQTLAKSVETGYLSRDNDLPNSILGKLIPAYTSFLGKFRSHMDRGNVRVMYNSAEDLQAAMFGFLKGSHGSQT